MSLQTSVQRAYTTGFAGQLVNDGPRRAFAARITSATVGTDPAASTNRMSRAFGYSGEVPATGTTVAAREVTAAVGGTSFLGILGHPQHHALYGSNGNALASSMDLPIGAEAEFFNMFTGMIVELFNETTATKAMAFDDQVAYCPSNITVGNNAQAIPYGGLISVPAGSAAPTGFLLIPNAKIINAASIGASSAGAPVSVLSIIQL
jgi:hypothetical protein